MAQQEQVKQSSVEEKIYPLDFSPAMLDGVTLESVILTYQGDNSGDDPPVLDSAIAGNIAYVKVSNLAIGYHRVSCLAVTTQDDLSPEIMLLIETKF